MNLLLKNPQFFHIGICLGHQLLWLSLGAKVQKSKKPLHGQALPWTVPNWTNFFDANDIGQLLEVQCYNSLTVAPVFSNNFNFSLNPLTHEIMAGQFTRGITFQFHPESTGTSRSHVFFRPLKNLHWS